MPHRFDGDWSILESEWRRKILPPDPLIDMIERLDRRKIAFDIGAGTGYFTVHLARLFERVYAVECNVEFARILAGKGLENVGIIVTDRPPEIDFEVDLVLFADSLHEIECKEEYADWCRRWAKYLAVIDWNDRCEYGPPKDDRINPSLVIELFDGFEFEKVPAYECHFFLFGRNKLKD